MQSAVQQADSVNSTAEDAFVQLFCEVFGPSKADQLFVQHPFVDIYGRHRWIDFALETPFAKIAIEIDGEKYHNPAKVSPDKYIDDLTKQNSLVYQEWRVYRWVFRQLRDAPDRVKDELALFLSDCLLSAQPAFLPEQTGNAIECFYDLRDYQNEALAKLAQVRESGDTIALLYHATGTGKTVTAAADAKLVNGKTLFLVNALKLADQAEERFHEVWPEARTGRYTGSNRPVGDVDVLFATIQSVVGHLAEFGANQFDYIIVDECHHAASKSYAAILGYFRPSFTLGLSATPERSDGEDILRIFKNVAHKMDLQSAVKRGILAPIRCFRIKTNIDLSNVRINGIRYNSLDLETKLFIPERNALIRDTYLEFSHGKRAVIFCSSVKHANVMSELLREAGVMAETVSGHIPEQARNAVLERYEQGSVSVLCACDLLNEGWDSPRTEVLFMARPTMSKTIYLQQLGRGVRRHEGKESLLIFDFVDNSNLWNAPYSLHRLLNMANYRPFEYVLAPDHLCQRDADIWRRGERPEALIGLPVFAMDYEQIDLFNWHEIAQNMLSEMEFVRRVNVQSETVSRYINEGLIKPDLAVPLSESRVMRYFKPETISHYADEFGWVLITPANIKSMFMDFIRRMDMAYSYKPVLLLAIFSHLTDSGHAPIDAVTRHVIQFYDDRHASGMLPEKPNSLFARRMVSEKDARSLILRNPFKRFADMRFISYSRDLEHLTLDRDIFKKLTQDDVVIIREICEQKITEYYNRLETKNERSQGV